MKYIKKVYELTEQLYEVATQPVVKELRDQQIDKISTLLASREQILQNVQSPFSVEDKQLIQQINEWNIVITNKFVEIKQTIQQDLVQLKKSKESNQQYVNPYQNVSISDGRYYDKRN